MSIAELTLTEHQRTGWLPTGHGDGPLMQRWITATTGGASLELPLRALQGWLKQQERAKPWDGRSPAS